MKTENPFYIKKCPMSYEDCMKRLEKSAVKNGFSIVHIHDMQNTFRKNNLSFEHYAIVELCNPQKAHMALSMDLRMGNMMPKEVIVYQDSDNKMKLMFMKLNPDMLESLFPGKNIGQMSQSVITSMQSIVEDAVKG